jgi:hypothetical protein
MIRNLILAALTVFVTCGLLVSSASSQRGGGFASRGGGARGFHPGGGRFHSGFYLPWLLPDDGDFAYASDYPAQPTFIVMQPPAPQPERVQPPTPLLIELRGDRYVQVSGDGSSGTETLGSATAAQPPLRARPANTPGTTAHPPMPDQEAPAVLVFRDGHREEVSAYTIVDGVLYANGNYYTDGSWNRKVALSSLNLPETLASNQTRGVRFQLPTSPNEVIVRP